MVHSNQANGSGTPEADRPIVLVIDDSAPAAERCRALLKRAGVGRVDVCTSGAEGFKRVAALNPVYDMVFTDLHMAGVDGVQLVRMLFAANLDTPIVVMTDRGKGLLELLGRMAHMGRNIRGTLNKPLCAEDVADIVSRELLVPVEEPVTLVRPVRTLGTPSERDLDAALAAGQIRPLYQPKVRLSDGVVTGVEALARWFPPSAAPLPPSSFIQLAETSGRILSLTTAMCQRVVADLSVWRRAGLQLTASLNVSASLLHNLELPDKLEAIVAAGGCRPEQLVIEITESQVLHEVLEVAEVLARLSLKGFELSIDDFGTGYASLEQLRRMPVSELKIDRSFVHGASTDPSRRAIQDATMRLARSMGLRSVAEGIETSDDLGVVTGHGCGEGQGYFFAKPMGALALLPWAVRSQQTASRKLGS